MEQKFYLCKHCGNIITKIKDIGVPVICCGEPMSEIVPGTTDAAVEKHVPVWTVENGIVHVKVGSVDIRTASGKKHYAHNSQNSKVKLFLHIIHCLFI